MTSTTARWQSSGARDCHQSQTAEAFWKYRLNTDKRGSYDSGLFKSGKVWSTFQLQGAAVTETRRSGSKTRAREIMDKRKAELILAINNIRGETTTSPNVHGRSR